MNVSETMKFDVLWDETKCKFQERMSYKMYANLYKACGTENINSGCRKCAKYCEFAIEIVINAWTLLDNVQISHAIEWN